VYDLTGKEVMTLINNKRYFPGEYEISWDGKNQTGKEVSSGIYLYVLRTGSFGEIRKLVLLR
jgi:flagellar hook assembly protein FlgD